MTDKTIDMTDDENVFELYHRISESEEAYNINEIDFETRTYIK